MGLEPLGPGGVTGFGPRGILEDIRNDEAHTRPCL
jgi:hypothetical protein